MEQRVRKVDGEYNTVFGQSGLKDRWGLFCFAYWPR